MKRTLQTFGYDVCVTGGHANTHYWQHQQNIKKNLEFSAGSEISVPFSDASAISPCMRIFHFLFFQILEHPEMSKEGVLLAMEIYSFALSSALCYSNIDLEEYFSLR